MTLCANMMAGSHFSACTGFDNDLYKLPQAWAGFQSPPEACKEFVPPEKHAANAG